METLSWRIFMLTVSVIASVGLPAVQASAAARGKALYARHCAFCHGKTGQGHTAMDRVLQPPPRKFADAVEMARLNDNDIYQAIKEGKPRTAMPAWGQLLSESQIRDLVQYVKSLKKPRPSGMTQAEFDIRVGERIYRKYCIVCHGASGDGQTTLGRVLPRHPRDFTSIEAMALLNDGELANAIENGKPGTAMVGWKSILDNEDVQRLILYIRQMFQKQRHQGSSD